MADLIFVPDVGLHEHGLCAKAVQFGLKGLPFRLPATGNDQAGPFLRKCHGSGPTDPGQGTRHHHHWLYACSTSFKVYVCRMAGLLKNHRAITVIS